MYCAGAGEEGVGGEWNSVFASVDVSVGSEDYACGCECACETVDGYVAGGEVCGA